MRYTTFDNIPERETELARAEREGAPAQIIVQRQQALEEAETVAIEVNRQYYGNMLWRRVNEHIESLEAQLQREELTEDHSQER